jgi:hypothetical protein
VRDAAGQQDEATRIDRPCLVATGDLQLTLQHIEGLFLGVVDVRRRRKAGR